MQQDDLGFNFNNSYAQLNEKLFTPTNPTHVKLPNLLMLNNNLAKEMGLHLNKNNGDFIAKIFSGNEILNGSEPIAQAYAGHQFGGFNMLGDGRAILLGEHITPNKTRLDVQLKGSGPTLYSRRGDGRATLRAMLREYLISETMHGLKIPTSRSLAIITTGENVYRETINEGAVLTRIASSHIRVGTFEYISNYLPVETLKNFTDYTINRHYDHLINSENKPLELLKAVMESQIKLIVQWMQVGFIHGVMNTDNMSIAGETFDYGPCAFLNDYNVKTAFSAIDTNGRYAFGNQPNMAYFNLSCLASALLPVIHYDTKEAIKLAEKILHKFPETYAEQWTKMMCAKIGLAPLFNNIEIRQLVNELLKWMKENKADYTNTFFALTYNSFNLNEQYKSQSFVAWKQKWETLLENNNITLQEAQANMMEVNPAFIARNHNVEKALDDICNSKDFSLFNEMLIVLNTPFKHDLNYPHLQTLPIESDADYQTFCGT
jgi:serine/tyrosine/threonine adenylyltransferase